MSALRVLPDTELVQLSISWMPPSEPNGVIIAYEVRSNSSGQFNYTNTTATQLTLRNVSHDTVVKFRVRAYTIAGPGDNVSLLYTGQGKSTPSKMLQLEVFTVLPTGGGSGAGAALGAVFAVIIIMVAIAVVVVVVVVLMR